MLLELSTNDTKASFVGNRKTNQNFNDRFVELKCPGTCKKIVQGPRG